MAIRSPTDPFPQDRRDVGWTRPWHVFMGEITHEILGDWRERSERHIKRLKKGVVNLLPFWSGYGWWMVRVVYRCFVGFREKGKSTMTFHSSQVGKKILYSRYFQIILIFIHPLKTNGWRLKVLLGKGRLFDKPAFWLVSILVFGDVVMAVNLKPLKPSLLLGSATSSWEDVQVEHGNNSIGLRAWKTSPKHTGFY